MPKVKESSLRGILRTFLVNFFGISLPLPTLTHGVHTSKANTASSFSTELNRARDETRSQLLTDLPFPFRSLRFTVLPKTRLSRPSPTIAQHRLAAASSPRFFLRKRSRPRGEQPTTNFFLSWRRIRRVCGKRFRSEGIIKGMDSKSCNIIYLSFSFFYSKSNRQCTQFRSIVGEIGYNSSICNLKHKKHYIFNY